MRFLFLLLLPLWMAAAPPNIVLIVSDDQGYRDLSCFGSREVLTPHLDRLAKGGTKLTNFYVAWPACTPSRGALLTGRYPQRNGIYDMIRNEAPDYGYQYKPGEYEATFERIGGMDTREVLLPVVLKKAGYVSGIFGKWDLGVHKRFLPLARGFDDFYGFVNTGIDYYTHERYGVPSMYRNNSPTTADKGTYCTDLFEREAVRFLKANHRRPFFLYLPFNAPHGASNLDPAIRTGAQAPEKFKKLYPKLQAQAGTEQRKRSRYGDKLYTVPNRAARRLEFVGSVTAMDAAIGRVLDLLDRYQIADNTIVIFFSDNGGGGAADNTPLRGGKGQMFEGGLRVPCIIRWPGQVPAGATSDAFLTALEIFPTLLAAANASTPKDIPLDGFDLIPVLRGKMKSLRKEMFWQRRLDKGARVGHWKWVESSRGNGLFDLRTDLAEKKDLSQTKPEILKMLKARFALWQKQMKNAEPRGPFRDF
ncbi:MAG: N-acetylgalactosamine-6-sulfatase [Verrucomicrobiales bacterium]|nr:N-acetylgalactosamine-6-sulfatase [Verrucomicrobiales bacterium]|tara:strand:- start:675 stop:2102 length:1428 start_codon:yes stop_codon:yes gene_type:complete